MPKIKNPVRRFFASVKLALITLFILAATSIIGTLIKQGQEPAYYVREYGASLSRVFEMLNITNMYSSWWFVALLSLFAVNLVVCSFERLPGVWRMIVMDNLDIDPRQLEKMSCSHQADSRMPAGAAADRIQRLMARAGWKNPRRQDQDGSILLFAQKGAWTRLGVYVVHLSILVILIGVMVGTFFGFQAYVFIPEGKATSSIFLRKNKSPVPLGFELQCDRFEKTFYANGMVKEYRSDLTVFDPVSDAPYQKSIIVNDPLSYQGLTFYQGDAYPMEEYLVRIRNRTTGQEQAFRVPPERDVAWQGTTASFRVDELKLDQDGAVLQARIKFSADGGGTADFWIKNRDTVTIREAGEEFTISFRQFFSTLLLVTKDPGILIVYSGCILMLVGLAISFLLSHRRVWVRISARAEQHSLILLSGNANKNKPAFEQRFQSLMDYIEQDSAISTDKKNS
jgi:cytochrome c biogenesis protein